MRRPTRLALLCLALAGGIAGADTAAWWIATGRMMSALAEWRQERARDGYSVSAGEPWRAGWPLRVEVVVPDVTLATGTAGAPDAVGVQAPRIRLHWVPWRPNALRIAAEGVVTLRAATGPEVTAGALRAATSLDAPDTIGLQARDLAVALPGGPLQVRSAGLDVKGQGVGISLQDLTLPGRSLPFAGTVAEVQIKARLTEPLGALHDPAATLAAWRDGGQRLLMEALTVHWGRLNLHGTAAVALDGAMQPAGSGMVQMTGFTELVSALARSGAITSSDARVVTTLLGLVARPGSGDGPEAELPWTLKDRILSVGAIPLMRMPVLVLP